MVEIKISSENSMNKYGGYIVHTTKVSILNLKEHNTNIVAELAKIKEFTGFTSVFYKFNLNL